jgi:hypothetical protein
MQVQATYQHLNESSPCRTMPGVSRRKRKDPSTRPFSLVCPYLAYDRASYDRAMTTASDLAGAGQNW